MDKDEKEKVRTALCLRAPKMNADGSLSIIGSDETQDSHGDVLRVKGWDLTRFSGRKNGGIPSRRGNPVIMWAHDYNVPPIGQATLVEKNLSAPSLDFQVKFAEEEEFGGIGNWPADAPTPVAIRSMFEAEILRGSSVGFLAGESKPLEVEGKRIPSFGFFEPMDFLKGHILMELSAVPIPSNPAALVKAFSAAWITRAHLPKILKALELCKRSLNLSNHGLGDDLCELIAKEVGAPRVGIELPNFQLSGGVGGVAGVDHNTLATCKDPSNFPSGLTPEVTERMRQSWAESSQGEAHAVVILEDPLNAETVRSIVREEMARAFALDDEENEAEEPVPERHSKVTSKGKEAIFDALFGVTDPS